MRYETVSSPDNKIKELSCTEASSRLLIRKRLPAILKSLPRGTYWLALDQLLLDPEIH